MNSGVSRPAFHTVLFVTSLHPSPDYPLRGVIIRRMAHALRTMGHRVEMLELGSDGGPARYWWARRNVGEVVRTLSPTIVHAHFGYSGLAIPRIDQPLITSFYGDDLNGTATALGGVTLKSRAGILISHYAALRSSRCVVVSAGLRERLWTPALRRKTVVIRDAVDPEVFRPVPKNEARRSLGIPPNDVLVIFPHTVTVATKRLWLAEAAVKQLQVKVPHARLWVVNGRHPDEMPLYYGAADAMIVTSVLEGGPSSVKEALACGLPVVSVAVGDVSLFEEVPSAMVRADPSAESLANGLSAVIARHGGERRSLLPEALTLERAAAALTQVYDDARDLKASLTGGGR